MPEKILIIEDEARMRRILQLVLETKGYLVETAADGEDGIIKWKAFQPDVVFTDLKMPRADGMEVLKHRNLKYPKTPLIILTAFGTVSTAVDAMKKGAFDYITKPVDNDIILEKVKSALAARAPKPGAPTPDQPVLIGSSGVMKNIRKELELVASTATSVFITGESGTGKELAARTIHALSPRKHRPFIRVNCAAIPRELMESELFGHVKGSFTGAVQDRKGSFIQADSGTLFLDEIGDMPHDLQAKVLHAVEDKLIMPVGSAELVKIDVKIISATNQNIEEMVEDKKFRSDLYFRLNAYAIRMPPLRERPEDIPGLAEHFLSRFNREFGHPPSRILDPAMEELSRYAWPGNVRELKNRLERLALVSKGGDITGETAARLLGEKGHLDPGPSSVFQQDLFSKEKEMIEEALITCGWNISKASRQLGITRNTLRYRIKKFGLREEGDPWS
nr:sigma-54-dependent Fis family transcriptional regulator [Desulfobacula sp.]